MKTFFGSQKPAAPGTGDAAGGAPGRGVDEMLQPRLGRGTAMDAHMFVSELEDWRAAVASGGPVHVAPGFELGLGPAQAFSYVYRPSQAVRNNGSLFFHTVFTPPGASPSPGDDFYDAALSFVVSEPLVVYLPKPKAGTGINLLTGRNATNDEAPPPDLHTGNDTVIISFLRPNVTLTSVNDFG